MTYLVVDDVAMMRAVVRDILIRYCDAERKNVYEANSGENAVLKYQKFRPDIVFLDINMPGTDGITVIKEIIKVDPKAKIIMCTASGDKDIVQKSMLAGASGFIVKPPDPNKVKESVEEILGRTFSRDAEESNEVKVNRLESELSRMQSELEEAKRLLEEENFAKSQAALEAQSQEYPDDLE
jgi:two-component system chemotaxis response regulator CheY